MTYDAVPETIRRWVATVMRSHVVSAESQLGGLSPGCASILRLDNGEQVFLKACGLYVNEDSVRRLREESHVMALMPESPQRPKLLHHYDDGIWVAHLQAQVSGRHANLANPLETQSVWQSIITQASELTPSPAGLRIKELRYSAEGWKEAWKSIVGDAHQFFPTWAAARAPELFQRIRTLPERLPSTSLCHWDLRSDNLLVGSDGRVTVVDWGLARLGPQWADLFSLSLEWAHLSSYDEKVSQIAHEYGVQEDTLTDLLLALAGTKALASQSKAKKEIQNYKSYARSSAQRYFLALERRLG